MQQRPDAIVFLNKAYNDLVDVCSEIAGLKWADAEMIDKLAWCAAEIRYWSLRMEHITKFQQGSINDAVAH